MIEMEFLPVPFKSAVMPTSGKSLASSCAPTSVPMISIVASQPACSRLNESKNFDHSSCRISSVCMTAPFFTFLLENSPATHPAVHSLESQSQLVENSYLLLTPDSKLMTLTLESHLQLGAQPRRLEVAANLCQSPQSCPSQSPRARSRASASRAHP